jgi:hypothetical protein
MISLILPRLFFVAIIAAVSAKAQLSQAGGYSTKIGQSDVFVAVAKQDTVNLLVLDYANRRVDIALTGLDANNSASGLTLLGRSYSFQVSGGVARGSYGGVSFTASKDLIYGSYASKAGGYNGVIQEGSFTGIASIGFSATGKVLLLQSGPNGDVAGIGQVSPNGQVTIPMTNGSIYSFVFRPDPILLVAGSGNITVNGRTASSYVFFNNGEVKLANISTRGNVSAGAPLTAGFVITGQGAKTVLIRGIGPSLSIFGVASPCPDTQLLLYSGQSVISTNNDWQQNQNVTEIGLATPQVGAFALPAGSRDGVLLVTLEPGAYTVQVAAQGSAGGEALVEVYQVN